MKVYTSYFYQIRNFTPNQIPVSTAVWDPKWFHDNKGLDNVFIDKNGVINGIRLGALRPADSLQGLCLGTKGCNCIGTSCDFLVEYQKQLMSIDFSKLYKNLHKLCNVVKETLGFQEEPEIMLIVYESPNNPCSERAAIQELFRRNGIECDEAHFK